MKIIEYHGYDDVTVEFQEQHSAKVHTKMCHFNTGNVKNPYATNIYDKGCIGIKYPCKQGNRELREYKVWHSMLQRYYDNKFKITRMTYMGVKCCDEWLIYENFYEWVHNQENYEKIKNCDKWAVDKDILIKNNKIYSPDTCCLVSINVNSLFVKRQSDRGEYPIGVSYNKISNNFRATCSNPFTKKYVSIGYYNSPEIAFNAYKRYKENMIKRVANTEYSNGNISKRCYEAMMNYIVEITD